MKLAFLAVLALAACDSTPTVTPPAGATVDPVGPGLPVDHPPIELAPESRAPQRLTVDMLQASLPIIAGDDAGGTPISWTVQRNVQGTPRQIDALSNEGLGRTLGRPDYAQVTEEAALPTPLYAKFMDDMARDVCAKMVAADATQHTLTRFASGTDRAAIDKNLRYLMLRFLGQKIADDDDQGIADLRALYDAAGGATSGWTAVCVGLFVSPSFHLY